MDLTALTAISPVDGRYRKICAPLADYFSEYALIKYRVLVEVEYFIALYLLSLPQLRAAKSNNLAEKLRDIYRGFTEQDALKIKEIEKTTNHDVKAVEYYLRDKFDEIGLSEYKEFIHFGLTSQDINNTATPLLTKDAYEQVAKPALDTVVGMIENIAIQWKDVSMLARTHGQPASPTKLGKEFFVFVERLQKQVDMAGLIPWSAKFGGATGNFNAHRVAYPDIDWPAFADSFVNNILGLARSKMTTQVDHYDHIAAFFDAMKRINTILIDFCRDIWTYISMDYFKQKIKEGEVGSSAMPHKVNPIDFENAEGNLGVANAIFAHLSEKLPVSRLQRDLTDSTVCRNIGVPFAHMIIALRSIEKGINKLMLNEEKIMADLEDNWAVVAEAIQTILRRENYPHPYDALKSLTRINRKITKEDILAFIETLEVNKEVKEELKAITPWNYTGINLI